MKRNRKAWPSATDGIEIVETDDRSRTLRFTDETVTWHSESGAVSESQLVFLENSRVAEYLREGRESNVFEVGFGTGLNFWLTATLAIQSQTKLNYSAVEPDLLNYQTVCQLGYDELASCQSGYQQFAQRVFQPIPKTSRCQLDSECVTLNLFNTTLQSWLQNSNQTFDAIYFDPFDPTKAPELWQTDVYCGLYSRTNTNGCLVTYCVKSKIQKDLAAAGYCVEKTAGPVGGKREVLVARKLCT